MEALRNNINNNVSGLCFIGWFKSGIQVPQTTIWHIGSTETLMGVGDLLSSTVRGRGKAERFQIDIYASGSAERERLYDDLWLGFLKDKDTLWKSGIKNIFEVEAFDMPFSEEEPLKYYRKTVRIDVERLFTASGF